MNIGEMSSGDYKDHVFQTNISNVRESLSSMGLCIYQVVILLGYIYACAMKNRLKKIVSLFTLVFCVILPGIPSQNLLTAIY